MKESVTYQIIFEKGEAEGEAKGERALLVRMATRKLGSPKARHLSALSNIMQIDEIEALGERLLEIASWDELLGTFIDG